MIAYLVASATTDRAERGKQAYADRRAVPGEVQELLARVKEYQVGRQHGGQRRGTHERGNRPPSIRTIMNNCFGWSPRGALTLTCRPPSTAFMTKRCNRL